MAHSVEKRLRELLQVPSTGPDSARDNLLLQLAQQVGASVRGIYNDKRKLREEEPARRIGEADRATWEKSSRLRSRPVELRSNEEDSGGRLIGLRIV